MRVLSPGTGQVAEFRAVPPTSLGPALCPQIKFERDLRRICLKAGLKEAPAGWQTPKIYLKAK